MKRLHPFILLSLLSAAFGAPPLLGRPLSAAAASAVKINIVTFIAENYDFKGPDRIPAGITTVRIVNQGDEPHHIQLVKLAKGKTAEDFRKALKETAVGMPIWAKNAGGPNGTSPGGQADATVTLEPGNYLLICVLPNQGGVPHAALGMIKPLTVAADSSPRPPEPKSDFTLTESDFAFESSKPVAAGKQTVRVVNNGSQPHEVVVVRLAPGASIKEFIAALVPDASGPPPGKLVGGITGIEKGSHGFFDANFTPGHYGLICFFPDAKGRAHFAQGMALEFDVR